MVREGATYANTVRAVKLAVNPAELGVNISKMRKIRDGHLLLEIKSLGKSLTEAGVHIQGGHVGAVAQLRRWTEVEVLDLDPIVDGVHTALQDAILRRSDDFSSASSKSTVDINGMWATKAGTQIATAKMLAKTMTKFFENGKVAVG